MYSGTPAEALNNSSNREYTHLLQSLHETLNGEPQQIWESIGLMAVVKQRAVALMSHEIAPGRTAGPTFDFTPD